MRRQLKKGSLTFTLKICYRHKHTFSHKTYTIRARNPTQFRKELNQIFDLNITRIDIVNLNKLYHAPNILLSFLSKLPNLTDIYDNDNYFNWIQKKAILAHTYWNILKQTTGWGMLIGILTSFLSYTMGASAIGICCYLIISCTGATLIYYLQSVFLEKKIENKDNKDQDETTLTYSEKQALRAGVEAKYWNGYLASFTNLAAYKEWSVFNSAKDHSIMNNEEVISKIMKLKL